MLILPGDPEFETFLMQSLPPDWKRVADGMGQQCCFVVDSNSGLIRAVDDKNLDDYLYGGEYDERLVSTADDVEFVG